MYPEEYKTYKKTIDRLANVSKGDELEIYKKKVTIDQYTGYDYFIHNPKKKDSDVKITRCNERQLRFPGFALNNVLREVITPKTKETDKLLTEPAQKDQRSFWAKLGELLPSGEIDPTAYR